MLEDSARLVRLDASLALERILGHLQEEQLQENDAARQAVCDRLSALNLRLLVEAHSKPESWNTDFAGAGGRGAANFHFDDTDDEGDALGDDLPLDCE